MEREKRMMTSNPNFAAIGKGPVANPGSIGNGPRQPAVLHGTEWNEHCRVMQIETAAS
jgi:hypothetical protein